RLGSIASRAMGPRHTPFRGSSPGVGGGSRRTANGSSTPARTRRANRVFSPSTPRAANPCACPPELNGGIDEAGFCWSPDGKRVAYLWLNSEKPQFGQEYEMFLMVIDADGQNPVTVLSEKTPFVKPIRYPQWR